MTIRHRSKMAHLKQSQYFHVTLLHVLGDHLTEGASPGPQRWRGHEYVSLHPHAEEYLQGLDLTSLKRVSPSQRA